MPTVGCGEEYEGGAAAHHQETVMPDTPVEVKSSAPAPTAAAGPDIVRSLRSEVDRLFDRFTEGFSFPSMQRFFSGLPSWSSIGSSVMLPAVDISEHEGAYTIT